MRCKVVWSLLAVLLAVVPVSAQVSARVLFTPAIGIIDADGFAIAYEDYAGAQSGGAVSIDRVVQIAQTVHDAERMHFGASSTREGRNADWARIVGIVHFGHPAYNPTPDPSWCIKNGGGGRPQSDDVIVQCRSRMFWDCIPGSGADGYRFQCSADPHPLPAVQNVYIPPRPSGAGSIPTPTPTPVPTPAPVQLQPVLDALAQLTAKVDAIAALSLAAREAALNATLEAASAAHDSREINADRIDGGFAVTFASPAVQCFEGKVPKAFGGSSTVRFCEVP